MTEIRQAPMSRLGAAMAVRKSDVDKYADKELSMELAGGKEVSTNASHKQPRLTPL